AIVRRNAGITTVVSGTPCPSQWAGALRTQGLGRLEIDSGARVDQTAGVAAGVADVLRHLGVLDLARAALVGVAKLAHELDLVVPALQVALGEHAPAGVARNLAADLNAAVLDERPALAFLAVVEALEGEQQ